MHIDSIFNKLACRIDRSRLIIDASMKEYTSFRAGGKAALLVVPESIETLVFALQTLATGEIPYFIMGNGTNLLVKDGGYSGVIVKIGENLAHITVKDQRITAEAGALLSVLSKRALEHSLTGLEFASGIPGSVGGGVFMNAGAYDGEIKQVVERVQVISRNGEKQYSLTGEEMKYGYRESILMNRGDLVLSAVFKLNYGEEKDIASRMKELTDRRNRKQPLQFPSAGSFFKRPPGTFAGKLIQDANLKGISIGGARVSPLHAGFIINEGGATASDIIKLMQKVQTMVYHHSGIWLEPEVRIIGE
ncbi:MAG: UDP-N-acetylmuramate dehydrogenase [Eubacteriales bacterium]|nr:UDP-N-acetylmuramate dehydrogenase [Eubacteriales bacterium]